MVFLEQISATQIGFLMVLHGACAYENVWSAAIKMDCKSNVVNQYMRSPTLLNRHCQPCLLFYVFAVPEASYLI